MKFSIIQWSGIFCCLLVSLTLISQSSNQIGWDITNIFFDNLSQNHASDESVLSFQKEKNTKKKTSKASESFPPPTSGQLLTDVNVSNTSPSANDIFKYKFRYRYASTTEHGTNAQIQFTFPSAYEIISPALVGGNISNIANSGNQYTISLESPASLGLPSGTLAAGSSGIFEFKVKFKCGTNGSGGIPSAGSAVNLSQNPVFTVTGVSNTASSPSSVTVPSVTACLPPPSSSGSNSFEKYIGREVVGQGMYHFFVLKTPTHSQSYTFTDNFPAGFKLYNGLTCCSNFPSGWTVEVKANGSWWNITNYASVRAWIASVPNGGQLKDQNGTTMPGVVRVDAQQINGEPESSNYAENLTGIRMTSPSGGATAKDFYVYFFVPQTTPIGWYQNCFTTTHPTYSATPDCKDVYVTDRGALELGCFFRNGSEGLGGTDLNSSEANFVASNYPNLYKDPLDLQGVLNISMVIKSDKVEGLTGQVLLPDGFDYIEGTSKPNYWVMRDLGNFLGDYNPASALNPVFTRIPNYNNTGRVLIKWDFPNLVFEQWSPHYINNVRTRLTIFFSTRYMGTVALPSGNNIEAYSEIFTGTVMTMPNGGSGYVGTPTQNLGCTMLSSYPPTTSGSVNSEKYVQGALDTEQSRYPISGNTTVAGDATYELFVYNHNFENIKQIDVADILPYIGDKDMLGTTSRGSGWSEELANAITVERYKIGSGLVDASSKIPSGVLYSNTYNACYLDGALPSGQVTAIPSSANRGQSGGCTDFNSSTSPTGAKAFAFRWIDTGDPLAFGEYLKITVNVTQLNGEADKTNNEVAWNSFAYTVKEADNDVLFSSEPLKVGVKMVDMASKAAFGGKVWNDANGDGRKDNGEPTFQGVTVYLYDASGNPITETVTINGVTSTNPVTALTDVLGDYYFYGLQPNTTYSVRLENDLDFTTGGLSDLVLTTPNAAGVSDAEDSDATEGTLSGSPATAGPQITLMTGGANTTIVYNDFGFYGLANVGNYVWLDDDSEGDQDIGESPVQGVLMELYNPTNNALVGYATTNSNGYYLIENVPPGTYYIKANNLPANKVVTTKNGTGNSDNDSDFNSGTDVVTDNFVLTSGESKSDIDLGLKNQILNPASICGQVWDDFDEDGIKDSGEPGLNNITVNLLDANGFVMNTTQTVDGGQYCFYNLVPNTAYRIAFVLSSVIATSYTNAGADMDANTSTGITGTYTPTNNQNINNVDCGMIGPFSIGNLVWADINTNGIREASEAAYSNVDVYLLNGAGTNYLAQTTTDAYGRYVFTNLTQGTYRVEIELPTYTKSSNDPVNAANPNAADNDDNGIGTAISGRVQSQMITLQQGGGSSSGANWSETDHGEPINGTYDPASNPKAYYTVDFGLIPTPPPPPSSCTGTDTDSDGITDNCDDDDDNDGILDSDECPQPVSSGLTGHITNFTTSISSTNPASQAVSHTLNSITYGGTTYSDFILPDAFQSFYTLTNTGGPRFTQNGVSSVFDYSSPTYDQDIIQAYQSRNLNAYQSLDYNNFSDGDYYTLSYNNPILSTAGGFIAVTERHGNNRQIVQALDINGNIIGNTLTVETSHYVDLLHNVYFTSGTQNAFMALYPIEDLAPLGSSIYGLRISFGSTATNDGPDAKVFFFGDLALVQCDFDGDGIPNNLDLDSDNDGCADAIEGAGNFTEADLQGNQLTGNVNANGVPIVASGGQGVGSAYNTSVNACCTIGLDTDMDGISDVCDVDDDNDGILDSDEGCAANWNDANVGSNPLGNYTLGSRTVTLSLEDPSNIVFNFGVGGVIAPPGFDRSITWQQVENTSGVSGDFSTLVIDFDAPVDNFNFLIFDIDRSNGNATWTDYVTVNIISNGVVHQLTPADYTIQNSFYTAYVGNNSFEGLNLTPGNNAGDASIEISVDGFTIDQVRIEYRNSNNVAGHGIGFGQFSFNDCDGIDTDSDGTPNHLDSDSDNDGCLDALEGSGNISAANIVSGQIGGTINSNGLPALANDGQGIGASQDAGLALGCNEICNDGQDNDGDGFIDCADSDCAPILSNVAITQLTCANKTGGQIVVTASSSSALEYSISNEPSWQSNNTFANLGVGQYTVRVRSASGCTTEYTSNPVILDIGNCTEICNDGIDNDGDGLIDCDDPDCATGTVNSINNN